MKKLSKGCRISTLEPPKLDDFMQNMGVARERSVIQVAKNYKDEIAPIIILHKNDTEAK